MRQLSCQIQDVAGTRGQNARLGCPCTRALAPLAVTTIGTYQLRTGDPVWPGRMPAWLAREINCAITDGIGRPVTPPRSRDHHVV